MLPIVIITGGTTYTLQYPPHHIMPASLSSCLSISLYILSIYDDMTPIETVFTV
jgi:hypothetical protein